MNILFDFISLQGFLNGGGEYVKKIYLEYLRRINDNGLDTKVYGLYNSQIPFVKEIITKSELESTCFSLVDINCHKSINSIVDENDISVFFIGIFQRYIGYDLHLINCYTVVVIHDMHHVEITQNKLLIYLSLFDNRAIFMLKNKLKNLILKLYKKKSPFDIVHKYDKQLPFLQKSNVDIIAVSDYTKSCILYYWPYLRSKLIEVLYSPFKVTRITSEIQNLELKKIIKNEERYILLVSSDRPLKNINYVLRVFSRFMVSPTSLKILTVGYKGEKQNANHIILPYLSSSDLEYAYKSAYVFVFASLFEGFGYPPLEAMKYGVPVICSNVCSMPEILGDSALYFSPFYESDLYRCLNLLQIESVYYNYSKASLAQYEKVTKKQEEDLDKIMFLLNGKMKNE